MGDDLGDFDDAYLLAPVVDDNDDPSKALTQGMKREENQKRKRQDENDRSDDSDDGKSKKKPKSFRKVLLESSRGLGGQSKHVQAMFLNTAMKHYLPPSPPDGTGATIQPGHMLPAAISKGEPDDSTTMLPRLKKIISVKKLKKWNTLRSPMVIIICLSARRAVAVLKELTPLKVRAIKLFAKHFTVAQQEKMLQESSFNLAVGTPQRIQALMESKALVLERSKLVVLDAHVNDKGYSVCTLPDTAPHLLKWIQTQIQPLLVIEKTKQTDLKLAFI